jgi:hypothetical protein
MTVISNAHYVGVQRFWTDFERVPVTLHDSAGNLETGLTIGDTAMTLILPDGTSQDYTSGAPANTWTEIGNGAYQVRLWGSDTSAGNVHEQALDQVGNYALQIRPSASLFEPVQLNYQVRADFVIKLSATYVPDSAGSDKVRGMVSVYKWYDGQQMNLVTDSEVTALTLDIKDRANNPYVAATLIDFTRINNVAFFDESISGLAGGDVLDARVSLTYRGLTVTQTFPLVSRFGA